MVEERFVIKFEGYRADGHTMDMGQMGHSLVGLDRVISAGLIATTELRLPKQREKYPLVVQAQAPRQGSVEIVALLQFAPAVLPLVHEVFYTGAAELVWRWLSFVFLSKGGRMKQAEPHFVELMKLTNRLQDDRIEEADAQRQFMLDLVDRLQPALKESVRPIGPSCDQAVFTNAERSDQATVIDVPIADAIRSKDDIEVDDMQTMRLLVDGFTMHDRKLKIEDPNEPGRYISAQVRDPVFDQAPNLYTDAAAGRRMIEVQAKPSYKAGRLHSLYVLDAKKI